MIGKEKKPRFGVILQGVDTPAEFTNAVKQIEDWGFDTLWITDSSLHARAMYPYLTLAALNSTRIKLGSCVTNPVTRHPAVNLNAMLTVDEISGGRAILGVATGDRPITELGYKPAPVAAVKDMVRITRRLLNGETVSEMTTLFSLNGGKLRYYRRADLPIYIAGSGPKILGAAGEVADGVLMLVGVFEAGVKFALDQISQGAHGVGRDLSSIDINVCAYGAIREDRRLARDESRPIAAWFPQTAPYYCDLAGVDPELTKKIKEVYAGGEFHEAQRAAALTSEDMVDKFTLSGTPEECAEKVGMLLSLGVDQVNFFPLGADRMGSVRMFAERIIPRFK